MQHQVYDTLYTGVCFSYSKSKRSIMDDDEVPQLSSHTLAALQEFYTEQSQQQQKLIDTQEGQVKDVELQRRRCLKIGQSETRIACGGHVC
jgi:hypothetical protein